MASEYPRNNLETSRLVASYRLSVREMMDIVESQVTLTVWPTMKVVLPSKVDTMVPFSLIVLGGFVKESAQTKLPNRMEIVMRTA
jgi:hypothetical protein